MARPATVSPDRILAAAALEFADRGFAGARVDRIARRARVNKAMLYYHFSSKQGLYRALLRQAFGGVAARLQTIAAGDSSADVKLARTIESLAAFIAEHPFFPAIMLREVAEGGAHLDADTLAELAAVPRVVATIVGAGVRAGALRSVNPIAAYFTIFAPIIMYLAGAPIRERLTAKRLVNMTALPPDAFVAAHQDFVRRAFARS